MKLRRLKKLLNLLKIFNLFSRFPLKTPFFARFFMFLIWFSRFAFSFPFSF